MNEILKNFSDEELAFELKKRKALSLKKEYDEYNEWAKELYEFIFKNSEVITEFAMKLNNPDFKNFILEILHECYVEYGDTFFSYNKLNLDKFYKNGKYIWEKIEDKEDKIKE